MNNELRDMVNDIAKGYMDTTRVAYDAGYEAGHRQGYLDALASMEARLKKLGDTTAELIAASREPALTKLQAG